MGQAYRGQKKGLWCARSAVLGWTAVCPVVPDPVTTGRNLPLGEKSPAPVSPTADPTTDTPRPPQARALRRAFQHVSSSVRMQILLRRGRGGGTATDLSTLRLSLVRTGKKKTSSAASPVERL